MSHSMIRIAASHSQARRNKFLSMDVRPRNLRTRPTLVLYQSPAVHFLEQTAQVFLATLGGGLVFLENDIPDFTDSARLLKKVPYPGPYGVKAIINPILEIKDDDFILKVCRYHLFLHRDHHGVIKEIFQ
jgi:hypothetical protein